MHSYQKVSTFQLILNDASYFRSDRFLEKTITCQFFPTFCSRPVSMIKSDESVVRTNSGSEEENLTKWRIQSCFHNYRTIEGDFRVVLDRPWIFVFCNGLHSSELEFHRVCHIT